MTLIDAGPLIAIIDRDDAAHAACVQELAEVEEAAMTRMRDLMQKYQNVPMDLADASLVALAESVSQQRIFTLDNDFRIYRQRDGKWFEVVP